MTTSRTVDSAGRLGLATGMSRRRQGLGIVLALAGVPALTALLLPLRDRLELDTALLLYVLAVVITSAVGGWPAALIGVVGGFMCANFFFTPPSAASRWRAATS